MSTFYYSVKVINSNDLRHTRVVYFRIIESNNITIQYFIDILIELFLTEGFCKIQSKNTRCDGIRLESALKTDSVSLYKHLKSVYGVLDAYTDGSKGFQFDLYPVRSNTKKRFYVRGVPDSLQLFDSPNNKDINESIISIEKLFIKTISIKDLSFRCIILAKDGVNGYDYITSSVAARLHTFRQNSNVKRKTYKSIFK